MKTALLTVAALLLFLNTFAQRTYDRGPLQQYFLSNKAPVSPLPKAQESSRSSQESFSLNYNAIDSAYCNISGGVYSNYAWALNSRFRPTDILTLRYALVNFDSVMYSDGFGGLNVIALPTIAMHLDSLVIPLNYTNVTGSIDTITVSVLQRSTVQAFGMGTANGYVTGTVLWSQSVPVSSNIGTDTTNVNYVWYPDLQFSHGETFTVRLDFSGDTANKFNVMCGSRDDCAQDCLAAPSRVKGNSLVFINWDSQFPNTGLYTDAIYFDCNQTNAYEPQACENIFMQNVNIIPYLTADVNFSASFPNPVFGICNGQNQLPLTVFGNVPPITYAWSPANGLSDTTVQRPYITSLVNPGTYTVTVTDGNSQTVTASVYVTTDQSICSPADTIEGMVYFDSNNNGQRDSGEPVAAGLLMLSNNSSYFQTDSNGKYTLIRLEALGTHTIRIAHPIANSWYTEPAAGFYTIVTGPNRQDIDFGIHVSPDSSNVRANIAGYATPPRPGFDSRYKLYCENTLGFPFSGVVQLEYDALQSFVTSSLAPDNVNAIARTVSWNVANLPSGNELVFDVTLKTNQQGSFGSNVTQMITIIPDQSFKDIDSFDNVAIVEQIVVGSYDPNDKVVSPAGIGPAASIKPDAETELTYTIRFQNTGTFYAENVTVTDTLDGDLDLTTFRMVKASHNYTLDKDNNRLAWHFYQIMLPDSNTNEPASHGFIQYKIKPNQSITHLSVIENTAHIYFDFNEAIVTNTTSNLMDFYLGLQQVTNDEIGVRVYPNPFAGQTNFVINSNQQDLTLRVTDIAGRMVDEVRNIATPFYTYQSGQLAKGMYNYDLRTGSGIVARGKLMIE